jgi:purine nucleosidase
MPLLIQPEGVCPPTAHTDKAQPTPKPAQSRRRHPALLLLVAALLALVGSGIGIDAAHAQTPRSLRIPPVVLPDVESTDAELEQGLRTFTVPTLRNVIVDTDPGVDDAAAILWLFAQGDYPVDVLGLVTVAGNTTVLNATNNALLLRSWVGLTEGDFVVVQGAAAPLARPLSQTGLSIHGPDGLWFLGASNPIYPTGLDSRDATTFYCTTLAPATLVIALGPLTNLAQAIQSCPEAWQGVEIVSLGGAKYGGNQTPVAEFNYWQDPEAAQVVLNNALAAGYSVDMVLLDAFQQFTLRPTDIKAPPPRRNSPIANLLPALDTYFAILGQDPPILPDPAAMMYALNPAFGLPQPALVKVLGLAELAAADPSLARGQTIIGLSLAERIAMIATDAEFDTLSELFLNYTLAFGSNDPDVIAAAEAELNNFLFGLLTRDLDNADAVVDIDGRRMARQFVRDVRRPQGVAAQSEEGLLESEDIELLPSHNLFVPMVVD